MNLTPLLRFRNILGPAECGQVASVCEVPWQQLQPLINPDIDGGVNDMATSGTSGGGCGCGLAPGPPMLSLVIVIGLLFVWRRRWR
jgi:MYXO-CTERM domain-containing protein